MAGVRLATRECNIRYKGRPDVMLMELSPGSTIAGVLTREADAGPQGLAVGADVMAEDGSLALVGQLIERIGGFGHLPSLSCRAALP